MNSAHYKTKFVIYMEYYKKWNICKCNIRYTYTPKINKALLHYEFSCEKKRNNNQTYIHYTYTYVSVYDEHQHTITASLPIQFIEKSHM